MLSSFQSPGDVAFNILGFPIYFYGIILSVSIFVGFYAACKLYQNFYSKDEAKYLIDFSPYLIFFGIIGARVYYCLVNFTYYSNHPFEIFNIRQGGLSIHGMIIAGVLGLYLCSRVYKISFRKLADVFLCGSILAQSIGRWGNFFNSEAFGLPTNLPWKLYIPISKRPLEFIETEYFHPTFLYESILDLCIFIFLVIIFKKCSKYSGVIASLYLILYSVVRIFVESLRIDSVLNIFGIPVAQIVSLFMIISGFVFLYVCLRRAN